MSIESERSEADKIVDGMDFGELCNEFECISSPLVESTARQLARDILELREGNRALGTFAVSVKYKVSLECSSLLPFLSLLSHLHYVHMKFLLVYLIMFSKTVFEKAFVFRRVLRSNKETLSYFRNLKIGYWVFFFRFCFKWGEIFLLRQVRWP